MTNTAKVFNLFHLDFPTVPHGTRNTARNTQYGKSNRYLTSRSLP